MSAAGQEMISQIRAKVEILKAAGETPPKLSEEDLRTMQKALDMSTAGGRPLTQQQREKFVRLGLRVPK